MVFYLCSPVYAVQMHINSSGGTYTGSSVKVYLLDRDTGKSEDIGNFSLGGGVARQSNSPNITVKISSPNFIVAAYSGEKHLYRTASTVDLTGSSIGTHVYVTFNIPDKTISGVVKDASGINALPGVTVHIFEADSANDPDHYWLAQVTTDAYGRYEFKGVYSDVDYHIKAEKSNFFPMFASKTADGGTYDPSNVRGGETVNEIRLRSASVIKGTITNGDANTEIVAFLASDAQNDKYTYVGKVVGASAYISTGLAVPQGIAVVVKAQRNGYMPAFHRSGQHQTYSGKAATPVQGGAAGVNITLEQAGSIKGTISGTSGQVTINVYGKSGQTLEYLNSVTWNANSEYTLPAPISNRALVVQAEKTSYLKRFHNNTYELDKATTFTLSDTAAKSGVNIALEQEGSITGTISGATGTVSVNVYGKSGNTLEYLNGITINAGTTGTTYTLPAPVNSVRTLVVQAEKSGYLSRFHGNVYELDKVATFTLPDTAVKSGVNIALQSAVTISGTITNGDNAKVSAFSKNGSVYEYVNSVTANSSGGYDLPILSGIEQVILASRAGYIDRYYQLGTYGTYNRDKKATPQKTASGGINITLQQAVDVAGSVKYSDNTILGIPLTVNAFISGQDYEAGYVTAAAVSSATGAFSMRIPSDSAGIVLQVTHNNNQLIGYKDGSWFVDNGSVMSSANARVLKSGQSGLDSLQIRLDKFWIVTGSVSPANIQGVVDLYEWESNGINYNKNKGWVTANASGAYEIRGTGNVQVVLRAGTENYVTRYLSNTNMSSPAWVDNSLDLVTNNARLTLTPLSAYTYSPSLTLGGQISGTISSSGGSGVVTVSVEDVTGKFFKEVTVNVGVQYTIKGIPTGDWKVRAARSGAMQTYYGGVYGHNDATTVNLTTAGRNDIDITLPASYVITGVINGVSGGTVTISAFELANGHLGRWASSYTRSGNGDYSLNAPSGVNSIVMAESNGYINRFYQSGSGGAYSDEQATTVNGQTGGASITLEQTGKIEGTITSQTGSGIVTVSAFEKNGETLTYISSITKNIGASGTYDLPTPVSSGRTLVVQAEKAEHIKRFYANTYSLNQATEIKLSSTTPRQDTNIDLEQGVVLSGAINAMGVTVQVFVREAGDTEDTFLLHMKTADNNGDYTFNVPVNKNYFIRAEKTGLFPGFYRADDQPAAFGEQDRSAINVASVAVTGKNFNLYNAGSIAGDVKYRDSSDIGSVVTINAFVASTNYTFVSAVTTNAADGSFNLPVPQDVDLVLQVTANSALGHASGTWFPDRESSANSTIFKITADLPGQHFIIDKFWYLTGKIALSDNQSPVGVSVDVFDYTSVTSGTDWQWLAGVTIDNIGGDFAITSINSVEAVVRFSRDGYVTMIYPDLVTLNKIGTSHKQTLTIGSTPTNLSLQTLARGGSINGNIVTQGGSGTVTINVEDLQGNYFTAVTRNGGGVYTVPNLPSGNWLVRASQDNTIAEYYGETASTSNALTVNVVAGQTTNNINIYIAKEWTISGKISEKDNSAQNITDALVSAYFVTEPNTWFWIASANTDTNGDYTLRGGYSNKQNNPTQIFLQISATDYTEITTNPLSVEVAKDYADQDYQLEGAAYVQGTVVNVSANQTVTISAFEKGSNFVFVSEVTVNGNDAAPVTYVLPIKANQDLVVRAAVSGYEDLWYNDKISSADAETVNQAVGTTKDAVNFNFAGHKQWLISGRVTDTDDNPLGGLSVNVFVKDSDYAGPDGGSVLTGSDGIFSLQIAPTEDLVLQVATANPYLGYPTGTYYKENTFGVIASADATPLQYSAGDLDIDFEINRFWLVSGVITPPNIEAVIDMYEYDGADINWAKSKGWVTADAAGKYDIRGTGNVTVNIRAATGNYISAGINKTTLAPENTYTYNFNLTLGASISGRVTANGSGVVTISAQDIDGNWETFVTRNGSGDYTIPRMPAGVWLVYAQHTDCVAEYFGETASTGNAVRINLTAGQTTDNINIEIDREWTIAGYVKTSGSAPVQDAEVDVWRSLEPTWDFIGRAKTDSLGYYIVTGGYNDVDVYVRVSVNGYEIQYYDGQYIIASANTVNMIPGTQKTDVDFTLSQVWKVAGNVKDTRGDPLSGVKVSLIDQADTQNILGVYTTDASGEYQFISVNAVTYQLFLLVEKDNYIPSSSAVFDVTLGDSVEIYFELPLSAAPVQPLPAGQSVLDTIKSGPNPADPEKGPIHIGFILDSAARARVKVYTLGGELVFQDDQRFPPGYNEFVWSGANLYDRRLPNGVYLAYVEIDTGQEKLRKVLKIAILR
ncbi:MAG: carboxypeptidase-like regulatory domain-containing protein [Candidatus Margulisbacteria bacterium]|nr:carboxypeptidase-like regulatory domain-containing protein [Candidatus Margulisiibacteriota bacterium]